MSALKKIEDTLSETERNEINDFLQNKNRLLKGVKERGFEDFDIFTDQVDWRDTLSSEIVHHKLNENNLFENFWKIDAIFALTHMKTNLEKRIQEIQDFKSGNTSNIYSYLEHYPKTLSAIKNGLSKARYTPFGITFLVPNTYTENKNSRGFHIRNSPISIVYFGKNKHGKTEIRRSTLEHEARHNIFDILELEGKYNLNLESLHDNISDFINGLSARKERVVSMQKEGKPKSIIESFRKNCDIQKLNIIDTYIKGLKDEILANFDNLIDGFGSTDMNHSRSFLRFLHEIDSIFEEYKNDEEIYKFKDILKLQSQKQMEGFYRQISFYFFIARNGTPEVKESIRQLFYLSDMRNLVGVDIAIKGIIGDKIYQSLQRTYPILTGIHLDDTLLGKNPQNKSVFALDILNLLRGKGFGNKHVDQQKFRYLKKDGKVLKKYLSDSMLEAIFTSCSFFIPSNKKSITLNSLLELDPQIRSIRRDIIQSLDATNPWKQKFIDSNK